MLWQQIHVAGVRGDPCGAVRPTHSAKGLSILLIEGCGFVIPIIISCIIFEGSRTFHAKSPVCLLVLATFGSAGYHVQNSIRCSETCVSHSLFRTVRRLPELRNLHTGGSNVAIKRDGSKRKPLFFN